MYVQGYNPYAGLGTSITCIRSMKISAGRYDIAYRDYAKKLLKGGVNFT
jgi:hypothetical protein